MAIDEVNLETRWNRSAMVQLVGMHRFSTLRRVWNGFLWFRGVFHRFCMIFHRFLTFRVLERTHLVTIVVRNINR